METQGLIKRRVQAYTTCFAFSWPKTTSSNPSGGTGGGEPGFELRLTCRVTKYITGHGPKVVREYRRWDGGSADLESCLAVWPGSGEDDVRDALRGMLRSFRALQDLGLTDGKWESIVPEDVVPHLADPQAQASYGAAEVMMWVDRYVRYNAARVLMTGCKEVGDDSGAAGAGDAEAQCSVCFDTLREAEAVELPGCAHAFHRLCISNWFCRKKSTCPLCRGDVVKYLDSKLQEIAELTDDDAT